MKNVQNLNGGELESLQESNERDSSFGKQFLLCAIMVAIGFGGFYLWNHEPTESMNMPKMVQNWFNEQGWFDGKSTQRWNERRNLGVNQETMDEIQYDTPGRQYYFESFDFD